MKTLRILLTIISTACITQTHAQTAVCSGSYTTTSSSCQNITVGDGTPGYIEICLDVNNIPSGGGSSCNPGGACNPPYNGGGWSPRIAIYDSGGNLIGNITATSAAGDCIVVPVNDGVAEIYGLCLTTGTTISWSTVDECGNDVCAGSPPPCNPPGSCDCANPCGPACGWTTPPTVAQVTSNCTEYQYIPELGPSTTSSSCYTFTAASSTVDFNVIITSDCSGGNVTGFSFDLYVSGSCGSPVISGGLADLSMSPLVVGQSYTFCYTFTTPACTHTSHYPYFVGAEPLEVTMSSFEALSRVDGVELSWDVNSEYNNAYFLLERSIDGSTFEPITTIDGRGTTSEPYTYYYKDSRASEGTNYYKLSQFNKDGSGKFLKITRADYIHPDDFEASYLQVFDLSGKVILTLNVSHEDIHQLLRSSELDVGFYVIQMVNQHGATETFRYFQPSNGQH